MVLLGILAALGAVIVAVVAVVATVKGGDPTVGAHPVTTTARVDDVFSAPHRSLSLLVRYTTTDGTVEVEEVETNDPSTSKGDNVKVFYDPHHPTRVELASQATSPGELWAAAAGLFVGSVALLVIGTRRSP